VPTSLSKREARELAFHAEGKRVVECGALLGGSTIVLSTAAREVMSIDRHQGYNIPTFNRFMSNLLRYGVADKVRVKVDDVKNLPTGWLEGDFAFIDLDGTYETTKAALAALKGVPYIGVHDVQRVHCVGVELAILESNRKPISMVDTLVVLGR
jgi:hypothetical protein